MALMVKSSCLPSGESLPPLAGCGSGKLSLRGLLPSESCSQISCGGVRASSSSVVAARCQTSFEPSADTLQLERKTEKRSRERQTNRQTDRQTRTDLGRKTGAGEQELAVCVLAAHALQGFGRQAQLALARPHACTVRSSGQFCSHSLAHMPAAVMASRSREAGGGPHTHIQRKVREQALTQR